MSILLFHVPYAAYDVEMLDDKVPKLVAVSCVLKHMQMCIYEYMYAASITSYTCKHAISLVLQFVVKNLMEKAEGGLGTICTNYDYSAIVCVP